MTKPPPSFNLKALAPEDTQKACMAKRWFATKNAARDEAARIAKREGGIHLSVYRCPVCHRFHLSSIPGKFAPQVKQRLRDKARKAA
jgi:hypothetical protein